jgi:ribosomal protein S18 acetylase RimI-like enzyme
MPIPEPFHAFWREYDLQVASVHQRWWGAIVTADRFPDVWDANYARVDVGNDDLSASEIEAELAPALRRSGTDVFHVVLFKPEETTSLITELSTRGHRLSWDLLMRSEGGDQKVKMPSIPVEEVVAGADLWSRVEDSLDLFGIAGPVTSQLVGLERDATASGKRWFAIRDGAGTIVSLASLMLLGAVGYLDNVATFPAWRGRGYASAVTARVCEEAARAGAEDVFLLADPGATKTVSMYRRLGFGEAGRLASTRGLVPQLSGGGS